MKRDRLQWILLAGGAVAVVVLLVAILTVSMKKSVAERDAVVEVLELEPVPTGEEEPDQEQEIVVKEPAEKKETPSSEEDGDEDTLRDKTASGEVRIGALDDEQDPQNGGSAAYMEETGAEVNVANISPDEIGGQTIGIDVSKHQGTVDWGKVKASGIDFAMIRVGYRAKNTGEIFEDPTARYNMQEAQEAGVMIGAYFFSTAVTPQSTVTVRLTPFARSRSMAPVFRP